MTFLSLGHQPGKCQTALALLHCLQSALLSPLFVATAAVDVVRLNGVVWSGAQAALCYVAATHFAPELLQVPKSAPKCVLPSGLREKESSQLHQHHQHYSSDPETAL